MTTVLEIALRAGGFGALFALFGLSLNVAYRATGVLSFLQGDLLVLGGLAAWLTRNDHSSVFVWILLAIATGLCIGAFNVVAGAVILFKNSGDPDSMTWVIRSLSATIMVEAVLFLGIGGFGRAAKDPLPYIVINDTKTPGAYIGLVVLAAVMFPLLYLFQRKTHAGLALTAMGEDYHLAQAVGLRTRGLQALAFLLSGMIAGTAGFVGATVITLNSSQGLAYVLVGLVALVIGGIGSDGGALVGGLIVGIIIQVSAYYLDGNLGNAVIFLIALIVFVSRPQGLFGRLSLRRV